MADETSKHILCECPALMSKRSRIWGSPQISALNLSKDLMHIVKFLKDIKVILQCSSPLNGPQNMMMTILSAGE